KPGTSRARINRDSKPKTKGNKVSKGSRVSKARTKVPKVNRDSSRARTNRESKEKASKAPRGNNRVSRARARSGKVSSDRVNRGAARAQPPTDPPKVSNSRVGGRDKPARVSSAPSP